jgi:hypothetical protein
MKTYHEHDCSECVHIISRPVFGRLLDIYKSCDKSASEYIVRDGPHGEYSTVWVGHTDYDLCVFLEEYSKKEGVLKYIKIHGLD